MMQIKSTIRLSHIVNGKNIIELKAQAACHLTFSLDLNLKLNRILGQTVERFPNLMLVIPALQNN